MQMSAGRSRRAWPCGKHKRICRKSRRGNKSRRRIVSKTACNMQGLLRAFKRHLQKMRLLCGNEGGGKAQPMSLGEKILVNTKACELRKSKRFQKPTITRDIKEEI